MGPNPNSSTAPTANVNGVFAGHTALQAGSQNGHLEGKLFCSGSGQVDVMARKN